MSTTYRKTNTQLRKPLKTFEISATRRRPVYEGVHFTILAEDERHSRKIAKERLDADDDLELAMGPLVLAEARALPAEDFEPDDDMLSWETLDAEPTTLTDIKVTEALPPPDQERRPSAEEALNAAVARVNFYSKPT